jgi:hypothetical protein
MAPGNGPTDKSVRPSMRRGQGNRIHGANPIGTLAPATSTCPGTEIVDGPFSCQIIGEPMKLQTQTQPLRADPSDDFAAITGSILACMLVFAGLLLAGNLAPPDQAASLHAAAASR